MKMPTWITLKAVPDEMVSSVRDIAQSLGRVLGRDRGNRRSADQKFCVALTNGSPHALTIGAINPVTGKAARIQVDYNHLPI